MGYGSPKSVSLTCPVRRGIIVVIDKKTQAAVTVSPVKIGELVNGQCDGPDLESQHLQCSTIVILQLLQSVGLYSPPK